MTQSRVPVSPYQYGNAEDISNIGKFAVRAMDAMGNDIVGPDRSWVEMAVTQQSTSSVEIVFGRIWYQGKFYGDPAETSEVMSLATVLPTSTKKIVTIIATGATVETAVQPRSYKNQVTGLKEPQNVATEIRRQIDFGYVAGAEAATPQPPSLDPNYVPIANVTLGTGGIEAIEMLTGYRLASMQNMAARIIDLEVFRTTVGIRLDTLASDIAATNQKIGSMNLPALKQGLKRLAELEDRLGIDEGVLLYGFDRFLTLDDSDHDHIDYKARVEEGLRFPFAATATAVPALLNPAEPRVVTKSGWTLPAHTETKRLDIWGQYISVNLSNYQYQNTSYTIYPGASRRRRYGPSQVVSANSDFWQSVQYGYSYLTRTFSKGAETWQVTDEWIENGETFYRVEQYWDDQIKYWNGYQSLTPTAANGYYLAQTFLNAQAGWLTKIGLRFQRVDDNHDVKVLLCKADKGMPDVTQVIATGTIPAGSALPNVSPDPVGKETMATMSPAFLEQGQRYAVAVVTGGDYSIACRSDNQLSNGALFYGQDEAFVADIGKDMNLRLYFADFTAPYADVQLDTVTLSGGITDLDIITREHVPEGSELYFEVQVNGVWKRLEKVTGTHPLATPQATLPVRMVMVGTRDIMPAIRLADSQIRMNRVDDDFLHLSETRDAGTNVDTVEVELLIRNWDGGKHALTTTILSGANTDTADTTTDIIMPDGAMLRKMSFTLTAPSQTYVIKIVGTSTDIVDQFMIEHRYDTAQLA